ncbi:MAG: class I SAM-dependent methyltransferase [Pyrinomonadaceae bacterium]|nr:class I SAM-dependent methyltransferase [Pyrinomonadaceae bacterium]
MRDQFSAVTAIKEPAISERPREIWGEHWDSDNQTSVSQRFFSFYRKAVFARTVSYFTNKYFSKKGNFVEAGCGTAETSMRINKLGGDRTLIAADIVQPILKNCHPVMDEKLCCDIFSIPLKDDSIEGIWNVGVMEHFTQENNDRILSEFYRILKPGHRIILLIPGTDSPPQKILRVFEKIINFKNGGEFRFHPPEISQMWSKTAARELLERNGFKLHRYDPGWRSLFAFKTLVGIKD